MYFFLSLKSIVSIHSDLIATYGGLDGIRDEELLMSALAQVSSTFEGEYLHVTIYEMAAAYLFHIVNNHPFIDGNKRTGIMTAMIFLSMHGIELVCTNDELEDTVFKVAKGEIKKKEISKWIEKYSKGIEE